VIVRVRDAAGAFVPRARWCLVETSGPHDETSESLLFGELRRFGIREGAGVAEPPEGVFGTPRPGETARRRTRYHLDVWGAAAGETPLPLGAMRIGPVPATGGVHEVRLPPERRITVQTVDVQGRPVAHARVKAYLPPINRRPGSRVDGLQPAVSSGWTGTDGNVVLAQLGPGPVRLRIEPPKGFVLPGELEVGPDQAQLEIRLIAAREAAVRVLDAEAKPVEGAVVLVFAHRPRKPNAGRDSDEERFRRDVDEDPTFRGTTDEQGRVQVTNLDAGRQYDLVVRVRGPEDVFKELSPWDGRDVQVVLGR
jgi:hypothetical protein